MLNLDTSTIPQFVKAIDFYENNISRVKIFPPALKSFG